MATTAPKILLTGPPGCGKTTLVRKVAQRLDVPARGFYTEEVRDHSGIRSGFDVVTLGGQRGPLAGIEYGGRRVGKYGVQLQFLEKSVLPTMIPEAGTVFIIDEIGKMECMSPLFMETVILLLKSHSTVLGTVALGGAPFIMEVRSLPGIEMIGINDSNRDRLVGEILKRFKRGKGDSCI